MTPLESPSAASSHACESGRCCTGQLHNARSNSLGRVSAVKLPFAVEEAAANSHFSFGAVFSPQGLQHHLIRTEGRKPITEVYYSQQSVLIFWSLCSVLARCWTKTSRKNRRREESLSCCPSVLFQPRLQLREWKTTNACCCFEVFLQLWCFFVTWKIW